jgi:hypothetical protein
MAAACALKGTTEAITHSEKEGSIIEEVLQIRREPSLWRTRILGLSKS